VDATILIFGMNVRRCREHSFGRIALPNKLSLSST